MAEEEAAASDSLTATLTEAVLAQDAHFVEDLRASRTRRTRRLAERDKTFTKRAEDLAAGLTGRAARGFEEARLRGGSAWLSFIPLEALGIDLDETTFRDAIALRMGQELPEAPPRKCPSCGAACGINHLLKCKRGGWISRRHKEVLKAWKSYLERGGATHVFEEPPLLPVPHGVTVRPSTTLRPDARADLVARGVLPHGRWLFGDIAVLDTGADCHRGKSSIQILEEHERYKLRKYADRIAPYGSFIPLVCSVYGTLAPAASKLANQVARQVDPEREERDAVLDLHQVVLQTSILKAASLCIRARSWAALPFVSSIDELEDAAAWMTAADARANL